MSRATRPRRRQHIAKHQRNGAYIKEPSAVPKGTGSRVRPQLSNVTPRLKARHRREDRRGLVADLAGEDRLPAICSATGCHDEEHAEHTSAIRADEATKKKSLDMGLAWRVVHHVAMYVGPSVCLHYSRSVTHGERTRQQQRRSGRSGRSSQVDFTVVDDDGFAIVASRAPPHAPAAAVPLVHVLEVLGNATGTSRMPELYEIREIISVGERYTPRRSRPCRRHGYVRYRARRRRVP